MIHERADDPEQIQPEDVEEWFANLPALAKQVERNRVESRRGRHRLGYLFAFITLIGLVSGYFLDQQADDIRASTEADRVTLQITRQAAFEQCQLVNDNARALNQFLDVAKASVRANETLTDSEKDYRMSLYESIKQQLPVCQRP